MMRKAERGRSGGVRDRIRVALAPMDRDGEPHPVEIVDVARERRNAALGD